MSNYIGEICREGYYRFRGVRGNYDWLESDWVDFVSFDFVVWC